MNAISDKTTLTLGAVVLVASGVLYVGKSDSKAEAAIARVDRLESKVDTLIDIAGGLKTQAAVSDAKIMTTIERVDRIAAAVKDLRILKR